MLLIKRKPRKGFLHSPPPHTLLSLPPPLNPSLSSPLSSAAIRPLGMSGLPLKKSWHRKTGPYPWWRLCVSVVTGVSTQSGTAVFVRKCLYGPRSPNAAQVLMAARGAFNEMVFVSELSVCQWLSGQEKCGCVMFFQGGIRFAALLLIFVCESFLVFYISYIL